MPAPPTVENIADNKYDTLAVEAAYLAHGQSLRIADLQQSISRYQHFKPPVFDAHSSIQLGAVVSIENELGQHKHLFIGPCSGGLSIEHQGKLIQVITPATPLGQALMGKHADEDATWQHGQQQQEVSILAVQ